jgi:hypothetical protein
MRLVGKTEGGVMKGIQVDTLFCDDVREESGNKLSYMGVYGGNLLLERLPAVLPKFCAVISLRLPAKTKSESVTFRLAKDGQDLGRGTASVTDVLRGVEVPGAVDNAGRVLMRFIAQVAPLALERPCRLQALVEIDDRVLHAGSLIVEASAAK